LRDLSKMSKNELLEYTHFLLRQYRLVDALWFLFVEDRFGLDAAADLNEKIWERMAAIAAKDIKNRFNIVGNDLPSIIEALSYFPWAIITGYKIAEKTKERVILYVPSCPPQEARLRHGKEEFPCKSMHLALFTNFAKIFNEKVIVECCYAPPNLHPKDVWCRWEFKLAT